MKDVASALALSWITHSGGSHPPPRPPASSQQPAPTATHGSEPSGMQVAGPGDGIGMQLAPSWLPLVRDPVPEPPRAAAPHAPSFQKPRGRIDVPADLGHCVWGGLLCRDHRCLIQPIRKASPPPLASAPLLRLPQPVSYISLLHHVPIASSCIPYIQIRCCPPHL